MEHNFAILRTTLNCFIDWWDRVPKIQVQGELTKLQRNLTQTVLMFNDLQEYRRLSSGRLRPIKQGDIELIAELAGLRIFVMWEDFLEQTFIRYMCGAKTRSGYLPKLYVKVPTLAHAREILLGGRPYINWESASDVAKRAEIYFRNGEPYATLLRSAQVHLDTFRITRNRIVHSSEFAKKQFLKKVQDLLGYIPPNMTPGRFLMLSPPPRAAIPFGMKIGKPPKPLLDIYADFISVLAEKIVR